MFSFPVFAWTVALLAAGTMGFAIQRGATCMVAAVDEAVTQRKFGRASALAEAALWVAGLLALGMLARLPVPSAAAYQAGAVAVLGGAMLGIGALVNEACVAGNGLSIG